MSQEMRKSIRTSRAVAITQQEETMRGVLLWLLGIPIPIIILIALLYH